MIKRSRAALAIMLGLAYLATTDSAWADPTYAFVFDKAEYAVDPGGTVDVQVYLQETLAAGDTSLLATSGLIGAGVRLEFGLTPPPTQPAQVLSLSDILPDAAFDDPAGAITDLNPGVSAGILENVDVVSPTVLGTPFGPDTYRVFLGTFRLTAGSIGGEETLLRVVDFDPAPASSNTVTGDAVALDGLIAQGSARVIVARAVPEPASLILVTIGSLGSFGLGMRRRGRGDATVQRTASS